ncbi:uncharacterized protein LOC110721316 [Chenopodium quinoa]|uniref:uncharacterized protein LOC110721316 n=1 Tax=Chenopodium quinoa TaxID=63459 RepID=UPI000B796D9D|nr:uncharacterized protein LOC110721316 [Chenopodium quinoa]
MATIRCIIALAAHHGWELFQLDVNNAFLHNTLDEVVYMKAPDGIPNPFGKSQYDSSLFIKKSSIHTTLVVVYVDDIIITGSDLSSINSLKTHLHQTFTIKDLGKLHYFLGIEVGYLSSSISLTQKKSTKELLEASGISDFKKVVTPVPVHLKLSADDGDLLLDPDFTGK